MLRCCNTRIELCIISVLLSVSTCFQLFPSIIITPDDDELSCSNSEVILNCQVIFIKKQIKRKIVCFDFIKPDIALLDAVSLAHSADCFLNVGQEMLFQTACLVADCFKKAAPV